MLDEQETIVTETPDVEQEYGAENGDDEEESESSEDEVQSLKDRVNYFSSMMERFAPLLERLDLQETNEKKKGKKSRKAETPKKLPWEQRGRDPTFTELAGSMVFSSNDSSPKDFKRRETIFDITEQMEQNIQAPSYRKTIPLFKGELKTLRFSEVNRFFKDLNAYQSQHNTLERGAPHMAWSIRTLLTPHGVSDEVFTQIPNKELFAIIRDYNRPTSQNEFREFFMQDLKFYLEDTFVIQASTYREWVSMVRLFFKDVMLRYEFLTVGLDPRLIPNIEDKDTGLVSMILSRMQPFHTAKTLHDEFFYEFRKKKRGYTLPDYISAFETKAEAYVQFARDAQAFFAVITTKAKDPVSSPVYARKFEYTKRFEHANTENYSSHNSEERKSVLFLENEKDEVFENNEFMESNQWPSSDVINPNLDEIDGGSPDSKVTGNMVVESDREELLAFVAGTRQPLKPMSKVGPPTMGSNTKIFAPGERRTKSE
jgi:hypothetical protein